MWHQNPVYVQCTCACSRALYMYMYHTAHFTIAEYCIITPTTTPPHYRYIPPPLPSSFPPSSPSWLPYIPPPLLLPFLPTSIPPLSLPPPSLQFTCTTGLLSSPDAVTICWSVWGRRQGVVLRLNWLVQFDCIPLWENLISQHHLTSPSLPHSEVSCFSPSHSSPPQHARHVHVHLQGHYTCAPTVLKAGLSVPIYMIVFL